jgi:hypothetical protein
MIQVEPTDVTDLTEFGLRWRWTDERWALLSESELARIKPLRPEKAVDVWNLALESMPQGLVNDRLFAPPDRISAEGGDVRPWLVERLPRDRTAVLVSWESDCAVVTDAQLFIARWDDFCYPASDDVSVFPIDASWVLHYHHEEEFLFARKKITG